MPVPERPMLKFGFDPLETMLRAPLADPEVAGANVAVNVTL